jgi:hypothetical protein
MEEYLKRTAHGVKIKGFGEPEPRDLMKMEQRYLAGGRAVSMGVQRSVRRAWHSGYDQIKPGVSQLRSGDEEGEEGERPRVEHAGAASANQ